MALLYAVGFTCSTYLRLLKYDPTNGLIPLYQQAGYSKKKCTPSSPKTQPKQELDNTTICGSYCGKWNTKKDAINSLFNLLKRKQGKDYRWYVNWEGHLEWFEVGKREGIERVFDNDNRIINFTVEEDVSGIKNYLQGSYGSGDDSDIVTVKNNTSIGIYGKSVDDGYSDSCMTKSEMTDYLNSELVKRAVPIYNATVVLAGFYLIEPGRQLIFPDDDYYDEHVWSVVDWDFNDNEANPTTTLNLTTDETMISPANEFEIIKNTAAAEVAKKLPEAARVVSVIDEEHLLVEKELDKSRAIVRSLTTTN